MPAESNLADKATPTIVLLIGLPGSGKSTWLAGRQGIVSSDAIRELLTDDATDQSINSRVFATVRFLLRERLKAGRPRTFLDATNLTLRERNAYFKIAKTFAARVEGVYFDVPLEVCKRRNLGRSRVVPEAAMDRLAARLQQPKLEEGFASIIVVSDRLPTKGPEE